ncbi:hypothetical protein JCM30237_04330 [Halolamina litorea]|uniref:DUF1508 domain-containing protein n=1 Tax=Halolamina litorea TaxID=1515593 RepID=A0ABD6BQB3_9EURY|nr:DUF1508 domain-containing protein [Halolamina litorea]
MSTKESTEGTLEELYRSRIGEPRTDDEVRGYWVFVVGLFLGVAGVLLFLASQPQGSIRQASMIAVGVGLILVFVGTVIRLPLQPRALLLVYIGGVVAFAGVAYFVAVFPDGWSLRNGNAVVITLYGLGLLIIGIGGIAVPLLGSADRNPEAATLRRELAELDDVLEDAAADEEDLAAEVGELRRELDDSENAAATLQAAVASLTEELAEAEGEETELRRELAALDDVLEDAAADEEDLAAEIGELRRALADSENTAATLGQAVTALSADLADVETSEDDLIEQLWSLRQSQARFELYEDKRGEYRFRLRHRNGNVIATGGEGYTQRHNAQNGIESVRRNALGAPVLRIEPEPDEAAETGDAAESAAPAEPFEEPESQTTFELFEDKRGEFRWRLRHDNGNIVADSGEGYRRKSAATNAIERVQGYAGPAEYLRLDPTGFEVYRDAAGQWRWRLVHRNGNVLADGGEGYTRRRDARRALDRVREGMDDLEFETYEDDAGEYRWRLKSGNGRIVADSGEGYSRASARDDAVERVRNYAPDAHALDIGPAAFEVFEDKGGKFRWRLRHRNGQIIADCGEGYAEKSKAEDAVDRFKLNAPDAEVVEEGDGADDDEPAAEDAA